MILISKGRGILTLVYLVVSVGGMLFLNSFLTEYLNLQTEYTASFIFGSAFLISGYLTMITGGKKKSNEEIAEDQVVISTWKNHSLFFIPMRIWAILFYILAVAFIALGITYLIA